MLPALLRRTRRTFSTLMAALVAAAAVLVCVPVTPADAAHCASVVKTAETHHGCDQPDTAMDCCLDDRRSPAVPATPHDVARMDAGTGTLLPAPHAAAVTQTAGTTPLAALRGAPSHGHRHIDLPTLNGAFRI